MNEALRQQYLKAMGLTPWVAQRPLPGAAPSPLLEDDAFDEAPAAPSLASSLTARVESTSAPAAPTAVVSESPKAESLPPQEAASSAAPVVKEEQAPGLTSVVAATEKADSTPQVATQNAQPENQETPLTFTLEAHQAGEVWLLCAQEDSQAPGLGRFEAPLMANLLALFQARPGQPRRFLCPLTADPMFASDAHAALDAFVAGLCEQSGAEKVLLALPETLTRALFDVAPYTPFTLGGKTALAISSLAEMLADPVCHKRASWQAMQAHGFAGG